MQENAWLQLKRVRRERSNVLDKLMEKLKILESAMLTQATPPPLSPKAITPPAVAGPVVTGQLDPIIKVSEEYDITLENISKPTVLTNIQPTGPTREAIKTVEPAVPAIPSPEKPAEEEHIREGMRRAQNLIRIQKSNIPFMESQAPNIKQMRLDVKKKIGEACNQIANTPSSIKLVVQKISSVLRVSARL
jgi:hypothetical protein